MQGDRNTVSGLKTSIELAMHGCSLYSHPIPPMTHPLSVHWNQPDRSEIEIDDTHALMSQITFNALPDYTASQPTGVYEGKMWRAYYKLDGWLLHWWVTSPENSCACRRMYRKILIA
jgi:hypothetical protein